MPHIYEKNGAAIYAESFATIRNEADLSRFSETLSNGLICNQFCNDNNQKIFAIYNFTYKSIKGPLVALEPIAKTKFQQIFGIKTNLQIKKIKKINTIFGTIPADEVILIYVKY